MVQLTNIILLGASLTTLVTAFPWAHPAATVTVSYYGECPAPTAAPQLLARASSGPSKSQGSQQSQQSQQSQTSQGSCFTSVATATSTVFYDVTTTVHTSSITTILNTSTGCYTSVASSQSQQSQASQSSSGASPSS